MNIPNLLSLFRLALVPVFAVVFTLPDPDARYWAVGIYALAFLTDIADGYIARRFNQITRLGRILDPMADKLMAFTVLICITVAEIVPLWAIILFVLKEATMGIGALSMYNKVDDVIPSNWLGKASTFVFFLVCVTLILFPAISRFWASILIACALALTAVAFFSYLLTYRKLVGKRKDS